MGLLKKDLYLIAKNLQPIMLIALFPPVFVAMQNVSLLLPILSIVIPLLFASQLSTTMGCDEEAKWRNNVTAMPISPVAEAGSKYVLILLLGFIAIVIFFLIGLIASGLKLVTFQNLLVYTVMGLFYSLFYGFITIPTTYKYGASNSKYFFMLFVFIPTFVPVILDTLNIHIDLSWIITMNSLLLAIIVILVFLITGLISFGLCVKVLKERK